ncbi:hypothetical protein PVAND_008324 [Polypedilum vanderplanki]|uniref:Uncharacterized protein n=1 Tax=Polypedilum vanderplanki TaxID=319348 RepID=A0A9J6C9V1_POLVA|nr:hypothetical protein PVAND_008324 [Polypedilum vanderplanki]
MNDNKRKVAFYFVLVILLVTLNHCYGNSKDGTEVFSHSRRDLPNNTIEITSLAELRRSYADKSVSAKLIEIRGLLRSLLFDWSLNGEIMGRTFGGLRIRKLLVPAAFLAGFLTAVILGILIIGVINMLLVAGVLILNLAVILGKLFYAKMEKYGHHGHHHRPYEYGSYAYADSRADAGLPFPRNFNSPSFPGQFQPNFNSFPGQPNFNSFPGQPNFNSLPFSGQPGFQSPAFSNQIPQGFNQPTFPNQIPNFNQQPQSAFPQTFNQQPSITPQQPPTNFQPQPQNINSSPFSGIQMQTAQQVSNAPNELVQPLNQVQMNDQLNIPTGVNMMQLLSTTTQVPDIQSSPLFNNQFNSMSSTVNGNLQTTIPTTTPAVEVKMINLQEIPPSMSPLDILNTALAQMGEKKNNMIVESVQPLARFKRKQSSHHHRRQISLLKPLS